MQVLYIDLPVVNTIPANNKMLSKISNAACAVSAAHCLVAPAGPPTKARVAGVALAAAAA